MDDSFKRSHNQMVSWVWVDIDTSEGMLDSLDINVGGLIHYRILKDQNFPF